MGEEGPKKVKMGHPIELAARRHQHQRREHMRTIAAGDIIDVSLAANYSSRCQPGDRDTSRAIALYQRMTKT